VGTYGVVGSGVGSLYDPAGYFTPSFGEFAVTAATGASYVALTPYTLQAEAALQNTDQWSVTNGVGARVISGQRTLLAGCNSGSLPCIGY
jgi:hypothetical protein